MSSCPITYHYELAVRLTDT